MAHNEYRGYPGGFDALSLGDDTELIGIQTNAEDKLFDSVIGHIEDVLMEDGFQQLQKCFMEKYWQEFEDDDENKLCYTEIFKEYTEVIERHIETQLVNKIPNFNMEAFIQQLQERKTELDGEVFEMLYTFSDFLAFKEMFLDYKALKEGTVEDLSQDICVTSSTLYCEENEV